MKQITEVMQNAEGALHLHQIVERSKQPEHVVRAFIREQSAFGNIEVVPTRGRYGNRYEWVGPLAIKEEILAIAKEVEAEPIVEAQLEPTSDELEDLPEELLAELDLPDSVTAQPKNATIEPKQATNEPKTFTNEPEGMISAENSATAPEPQANAPVITAPSVNPKIGYMITAAKGKMERRKSHEAARRLAKQWKKGRHKNIAIHSTLEMERPRLGVFFE